MKTLVFDFKDFVNEMFNSSELAINEPSLKENFFKEKNLFDFTAANATLDTLVTNYNFRPENQAINIEPTDTVRFYTVSPGKFTHAKQLVRKKMLDDIQAHKIENPKQEIYYHVIQGSKNDPESSQKVEVVGILAMSTLDET